MTTITDIANRFRRDGKTREVPAPLAAAINALFTFYDQPFSDGDALVYARVLRGVTGITLAAVLDEIRLTRTFLPRPTEVAVDLETVCQRLRVEHRFVPCAKCTSGWIEQPENPEREPQLAVRLQTERRYIQQLRGRRGLVPVLDADGHPVLDEVRQQPRLARCSCYTTWERRLGLPLAQPKPTLQLDAPKGDMTDVRELVAPMLAAVKKRLGITK